MNTVIYIPPEDDRAWRHAQKLLKAEDLSISAFVMHQIKAYIARAQRRAGNTSPNA